jgi:hypothetical protein
MNPLVACASDPFAAPRRRRFSRSVRRSAAAQIFPIRQPPVAAIR